MGLFATIPGLREAVEAENRVRDAALLGLPDRICGFYVRLLTLDDYLALRLIRNPFIVGGHPSPEAAYELLKRMATSKRGLIRKCRDCRLPRGPFIRTQRAMMRWETRAIKSLERLAELSAAIHAYVEESTQDWPIGKEDMGDDGSAYGLGVSICAMMLREYNLPFEQTLKMPLKVSLQCVKEIQFRGGRRAFNSPSKKVINDWLLERNN